MCDVVDGDNGMLSGPVICRPLRSLKEVYDWKPSERDILCRARVPLPPSMSTSYSLSPSSCASPSSSLMSVNRRKLLVCHDMMGGYLDDRFVEGVNHADSYRFTHWWLVDTFVYFSHHLVTIPPPCWSDAAHKHGVKVLGTVITEPSKDPELDGTAICSDIFASEQSCKVFADQLLAIAVYFKFDGWLLNIENQIHPDQMRHVLTFVRYLTDITHARIGQSQVIWYDSVTDRGELAWQNQLNAENKCFFDLCDGIFLNYTWTEELLAASRDVASMTDGSQDAESMTDGHNDVMSMTGRCHDVYGGCDVFGRGSFGGGGFNTRTALEALAKYDLSCAVFAPGWTYECLDKKDFSNNNRKFWTKLCDLCPHRRLTQLPIVTSFCQGWGMMFNIHGKTVRSCPWTNLSLQQLQPVINSRSSCTADSAMLGHATVSTVLDAQKTAAYAELGAQETVVSAVIDAQQTTDCSVLDTQQYQPVIFAAMSSELGAEQRKPTLDSTPDNSCFTSKQLQPTGYVVTEEHGCMVEHVASDAFNGGGCLRVSASLSVDNPIGLARIFSVDAIVSGDLIVTYATKSMGTSTGNNNAHLSILLSFQRTTQCSERIKRHLVNGRESLAHLPTTGSLRDLIPADSVCLPSCETGVAEEINSSLHGWITRTYRLVGLDSCVLRSVIAVLHSSSASDTVQPCAALLGQIKIIPQSCITRLEHLLNLSNAASNTVFQSTVTISADQSQHCADSPDQSQCSTKSTDQSECSDGTTPRIITLRWTLLDEKFYDVVSHYHVMSRDFRSAEWRYLGTTSQNSFTTTSVMSHNEDEDDEDDEVVLNGAVEFRIDAVTLVDTSCSFNVHSRVTK